ncbi:TAXI family TRAP transporter solute-binding subunit [Methylobacterium sp. J-076]|uniref:TAXI family TRAP transporter solute-binding subunit n=1 Tax=Methylobacterium sp. J-076 TaxID=2836655 RepID=UPI001FB90713|nr:TAXI family TRAP transporter solute-binding subunit [Methylobacterium sp. J-076]MCJ2014239.1 C4-dicarboxylate ABC transporter substrate-binding protein [Methylobacterium sp. J-076]
MGSITAFLLRREVLLVGSALLLCLGGAAVWYLLRPTTLTIAVAPKDGTEPGLIKAYSDAIAASGEGIRLKILPFDDVRESAAALQDGRADLAVVRPDVLLPTNGLTLAILRDQAMIVASPEPSGIKTFAKLGGKRLGIGAQKDADYWLLKNLLSYHGLTLETAPAAGPVAAGAVQLVPVDEGAVAGAFKDKRIDAFLSIIAPSAPKALALVAAVRSVARDGKVEFVAVEDDDAIIERFPKLQAVTIPGGLFAGRPKLPADDVKTVGASYRLMARSTLNRVVAADFTQQLFEKRTAAAQQTDAAEYVLAPAYDTTVAATSARIPIHPGAIDYYEREQHGFVERYGDTLYLLGALAGGLVSMLAWVRQRLTSLRRERIDDVMDRLLEITGQARSLTDPAAIEALTIEVDGLATDVVRFAREREPDSRTMSAVSIAIDTARATIHDCRLAAGGLERPPRSTHLRTAGMAEG